MSTPIVYVFCDNNCKFESMTKEQIIAAIAEATGNVPTDVNAAFITKIKAKNRAEAVEFWIGTEAELNAETTDTKTIYCVEDSTTQKKLLVLMKGEKGDPGSIDNLPVGDADTLGGVMPVAKTDEMTQDVGADENGKLYTKPYTLPTAKATVLGGVMPTSKTTSMTQEVGVDTSGKLYTKPYTLPTAKSTVLGGVMPVAKTDEMTQDVGVDTSGKLYIKPPTANDIGISAGTDDLISGVSELATGTCYLVYE